MIAMHRVEAELKSRQKLNSSTAASDQIYIDYELIKEKYDIHIDDSTSNGARPSCIYGNKTNLTNKRQLFIYNLFTT